MRADLLEIWRYRELLLMFVQRDLKVRYKNSFLGFGWSLINPLMQVAVLTVVLLFLMPQENRIENYHAYVFCAMVPWLFFSTAMMDSTNCLLMYYTLLRKTYFPREIIPIASVIANLIHFGLSTVVLFLYLVGIAVFHWLASGSFNLPILWTAILVPLPMLGLAILVTGLSFFVSVWTLYFEDVRYLMDSGLKILYWLVPVIYFSDAILEQNPRGIGKLLYTIYMLNPLSGFITAFRKLTLVPTKMLGTQAVTPPMGGNEWLYLGIGFLTSLVILALGLRYFSSRKWSLAERG
ncbi:MAG: ABC transporter permease [Actinomycetota bacterium]